MIPNKLLCNAGRACLLTLLLTSWSFPGKQYDDRTGSARMFFRRLAVDIEGEANYDKGGDAGSNLVILIGENHASSKNQIALAAILDSLYKRKLLDKILIEGSNGGVRFKQFADRFSVNLRNRNIDVKSYWKQQLSLGKISGFEFFALNHSSIEVTGVEDMAAKEIYAITSQTDFRKAMQFHEKDNNDAINLFTGYINELKGKVEEREYDQLDREFKALKDAMDAYSAFYPEFLKGVAPLQIQYKRLADLIPAKYAKINVLKEQRARLEARMKAIGETRYKIWVSEYSNAVIKGSQLYEKSKNIGAKGTNDPKEQEAILKELIENNRQIDRLEAEYPDCSAYLKESARLKNGKDYRDFQSIMKKSDSIAKELNKEKKNAKTYFDRLRVFNSGIENQHFILANHIIKCGRQHMDVKRISSFFAYNEKKMQRDDSSEVKDLYQRDLAMVANTKANLQGSSHKIAVLIVGYAHLAGMSEKFKQNNISFIAGGLKARNEATELWENAAWQDRRQAGRYVFSDSSIKELTRLLNERWKLDQSKFLSYFNHLKDPIVEGLHGGSSIYGNLPNIDLSIHVGAYAHDKNANFGSHLVEWGLVPGKDNEFYEVFDKSVGKALVKDDLNSNLAYYYKERQADGKVLYKIATAEGTYGVREFKAEVANGKKFVLFGEPDEIDEGGVVVSQLWKYLKGGQDAMGGAGVEASKANLLRTINSERASINLATLAKQQPEYADKFTFIGEAEMGNLSDALLFTPERGDNAQTVVFLAKNTEEFRQAIKKAADERLLVNKQVVLISCGHEFAETAEMREAILNGGALMVWTADRQIPEDVGRRLVERIKAYDAATQLSQRHIMINDIMRDVLGKWQLEEPTGDWRYFNYSAPYVEIRFDCHSCEKEAA